MKFFFSLFIFFFLVQGYTQELEAIEKLDTIIVEYDRSKAFLKYMSGNGKTYQDSCYSYVLKFRDTLSPSYIRFTDCSFYLQREYIKVHKEWIRNKAIFGQEFFHKLGFRKSSKKVTFHRKVVYMYDKTIDILQADSLDLIRIRTVTSSYDFAH